jgi:two-component system, OmpR family, KDP operon response regulator KdpE
LNLMVIIRELQMGQFFVSHYPFPKGNVTTLPQPFSVLVVDDEAALRRTIRASLMTSGFAVEEAGTGADAIGAVQRRSFDLVLLDVNMPGMSGVEVCRQIRALAPRTGIVMVTVRDGEEDKVRALEAGADDYVTKPFRFRELIARLRAVLRRLYADTSGERGILQTGDLKMDLEHHLVWKAGQEIRLSPKEFDLLSYLWKNQGAPLTHTKLLRAVWGPEYGNELEYLRTYVRMLRKKIEDDPAKPQYILTDPWVGYRFCNPSEDEAGSSSEDDQEPM